jgi:hypothetical protein
MELIAVLEIDGDCVELGKQGIVTFLYVLCKIAPKSSMVSNWPHLTLPPSYLWPPSQPQNNSPSTCDRSAFTVDRARAVGDVQRPASGDSTCC